MPTLDATPGGASANSYSTVAEADSYHDARLFSADWTGATSDDKARALIMATRVLDAMMEWGGVAATTTQALKWPRVGMLDYKERLYVLATVIPDQLKNATAELARQLIKADRTLDSDVETLKLSSLSAGSVHLSFGADVTAKVVPDAVVNLLPQWWGYVRGRVGYVRLER